MKSKAARIEKSLMSFQDVADLVGATPDVIRTLVVEERVLKATLVTNVGHKEPYEFSLDRIGDDGSAVTIEERHRGYLRIDRKVLDLYLKDSGINPRVPDQRQIREETFLNIIGALLQVATDPKITSFSQAKLVDELLQRFPLTPAISRTTLNLAFADANRSMKASKKA